MKNKNENENGASAIQLCSLADINQNINASLLFPRLVKRKKKSKTKNHFQIHSKNISHVFIP